jgi:hypothetical protein
LSLVAVGATLVTYAPGLEGEYFAFSGPWEGRPFGTRVEAPGLASASGVNGILLTKVVFSIRWTGWWHVGEAGEHRFALDADDGGYLRIGSDLLVDTGGVFGEPRLSGTARLEPGFHPVETGLYQTHGESRLAIHWAGPGTPDESAVSLPVDALYAGRPLGLRRALRWALADWSPAYRRLLGAVLLISALLLAPAIADRMGRLPGRLRVRLPAVDKRRLRFAFLLVLFLFAFFATLPLTGTVRAGDDTAYLRTATFDTKEWFFQRYAHIYLLKLFATVSGDPLVGVRVWWSFVFAATVAALAVAVASIDSGLQLRTLAVTLFVLLAQTSFMGLIGAGFADYSAAMFITAAVATYLHGLGSTRRRPPPGHEWHALLIGVLTVCAFRSKEVGAVLLLLPLLFVIDGGRIDARSFLRKIAYWAIGSVAALLVLMALDGWILGDAFFTLDSSRMQSSKGMNFPERVEPRRVGENWLRTLTNPHGHASNMALRNLWLLTCAAAIAAGLRRTRLEIRLLHFVPLAYMLALLAIYVRLPHPFSSRMLIPILPVACLTVGLLLHYAGLDAIRGREMLKVGFLVPVALAAAVIFLVVVPYRLGTVDADAFLPVDRLQQYGWDPDQFLVGVLAPAIFLTAVAGAALVAGRQRGRLVALVILYLAAFGVGFEVSREGLTKRFAPQVGELLLYPWRTFRAELNAIPAHSVALERGLRSYYNMSAGTQSLADLALGRLDVHVVSVNDVPTAADAAIASRHTYERWVGQAPELAATATFDPLGFLVLVRPKEASERADGTPPSTGELPIEQWGVSLGERLAWVGRHRDPETRNRLLQWMLDSLESPSPLKLQALQGERVQTVGLTPDGWTNGTQPAGLVLRNLDPRPLARELSLTVGAPAPEYPIQVSIDDGVQLETVRFEEAGTVTIRLRPVPPRSTRLIVIWSDTAWTSATNRDRRQLGVHVSVSAEANGAGG